MTSIGLVLGAGGAVGAAYHAGVVHAIEEATGWDPREATVIVGTSAGAGIAASLRSGLSAADHFARALDEPLSEEGESLLDHLIAPVDLPTFPRTALGLPRPASPGMLAAPIRRLDWLRPGVAFAALAPRGAIPSDPIAAAVQGMATGRWPEQPTWICAVSLGDGRRVVFGRDDVAVDDLGTAVQASSAVPSFFRPVRIGDHDYVDGAVHSSTNADLLSGIGLDLVIVVAPMAAVPNALGRSLNTGTRFMHAEILRREVRRLRGEGLPVVVVQPTRDDLRVMGINAMDRGRRGAVASQSRRSTLQKFERADLAPVIECLADAAAVTVPTTPR